MTEEKMKLVEPILNTFENEDIKEFAVVLLDNLPEYIWHVGASSTGKYHPQYSLGEGGLMRHQIAVVRFLNFFFELEQYRNVINSRQRDLMRIAGFVHDGRKSGSQEDFEKSKFTKFNHPELMVNTIKSYTGKIGSLYMTVCENIPEGMEVKEEHTVISPDEGKYFLHNGELINSDVVLQEGESPEDYQELDIPDFMRG